MRPDMDLIMMESARSWSASRSMKTGLRIRKHDDSEYDDLDLPRSTFTPLRRFLQKNIGQPWNSIYSDICWNTDRRTFRGNRLLKKLEWEVEIDCVVGDDGKVYTKPSYGYSGPVYGFYVHPETGLLQWEKSFSYKVEKPKVERLEFVSSVEVLFQGRNRWSHDWMIVKKVRLLSPSQFYSKRYAKTVLEKNGNGWQVHYHELYDPEETVSRIDTPDGVVVKRRRDCPDLPISFVIKTKTTLNKKELQEVNRLLLLSFGSKKPVV